MAFSIARAVRVPFVCGMFASLAVPMLCSSEEPAPKPAAAVDPLTLPEAARWKSLFDGKELEDLAPAEFGGEGEVTVENGEIVMQRGSDISGVRWKGKPLPKKNYEITFESRRIDGSDFFCGLGSCWWTAAALWSAVGWRCRRSSVDGLYAADNDTATHDVFKEKQWYKIRLRVGEKFVRAWIDDKSVVDLDLSNRKVSLHPAVDPAKPLGISCYATVAGLRKIYFRELTADEAAGKVTVPPALPTAKAP